MTDLERYERLLRYELACQDAAERLLPFSRFTMPHPRFPHDATQSRYSTVRAHEKMADLLECMERGDVRKAIVTLPPRMGKTQTVHHNGVSWMWGRHPDWDIISATYGETFARDHRNNIRTIIDGQRFRQAFPEFAVRQTGPDELLNHFGGHAYFLGRRSPTTGRGGNFIVVDDPVKDDKEGRSQVYRDDVWEWFTQTLWTRRHHDRVPVLLTMTRWHDDDIVGRITDKSNPKYAPKFADGWEVLRLPAIAEEDDPIGRAPGEALWPERYGVEALEEMRDANPVAFSALYQGDPAPEDGVFYLSEDIHTYDREDLERVRPHLVYYAASDHAVSTTQINDLTCMGIVGVDPTGTAYVMPDLVWRRIDANEAVEQMIRLIKAHKPRWWYAERGHITRAIGPFLKKRMQEEGIYCPVIEDQPVADKTQRAQSARARAAQGKIRFPAFASWWPKAKSEMLRFPNARHDDFVDMLSTIGLKLQSHVVGTFKTPKTAPKEGTWAWQKAQWAQEDEQSRRRRWG